MTPDLVSPADVAHVLQLIADTPNRRQQPLPRDVSGKFDYWFDGGACAVTPGSWEFVFADGAKATVLARLQLHVCIEFACGKRVEVIQEPTLADWEETRIGEGWVE